MCTMSMIYDHFRPMIPDPDWILPAADLDALRQSVADFQRAKEAAAVVDETTGRTRRSPIWTRE